MTQTIRTVIVDDEPLALSLMRSKLEKIPSIEIVAECKNGREAVTAVNDLSPHLIFLDIQMPGMSGLDVIKKLQGDTMPVVVFATAFEQYALDAFDANAVDYILKPIDSARIERAIARATKRIIANKANACEKLECDNQKVSLINAIEIIRQNQSQNKDIDQQEQSAIAANKSKIIVKDRDEIHILDQRDIEWIDAAGDYVCIHSKGETYIKRTTLKEILDELNSEMFKRVHRSTIVNLNCIKKVLPHTKGEFFLLLSEYDKIKVSRNFKEIVKDFLAS